MVLVGVGVLVREGVAETDTDVVIEGVVDGVVVTDGVTLGVTDGVVVGVGLGKQNKL